MDIYVETVNGHTLHQHVTLVINGQHLTLRDTHGDLVAVYRDWLSYHVQDNA